MEGPVEIRYAGVAIGRAESAKAREGEAGVFFLPLTEPMPVGTRLELRAGADTHPAHVIKVVEGANSAGMEVRLGEPAGLVVSSADTDGVPEAVGVETSGPTEASALVDANDVSDPAGGKKKRKKKR